MDQGPIKPPRWLATAAARRDLQLRRGRMTTEASQIRLVLRRRSWNPRLEKIMNDHATRIEGATRPRLERRARASAPGRGYVISVTLLAGAAMLAAGIWSLAAPRSFAEAVKFPYAEHFIHDLGAFQVGNTVHAVNHVVDLDLGGRGSDPWLLGLVSVLIAAALALRLKEIGYVVGAVGTAATPKLEPFVRQKTALLVTYRRDGTPVGTPLSVAVDGDHAFFRSYERAWKTRRLRNRSDVELMPSTARGKPTGAAIHGRARRLEGAEARQAAHALARKHPLERRAPAGARRSALEGRHDRAAAQRVPGEDVAEECGRGVRGHHLEAVGVQRVDNEEVAVRAELPCSIDGVSLTRRRGGIFPQARLGAGVGSCPGGSARVRSAHGDRAARAPGGD